MHLSKSISFIIRFENYLDAGILIKFDIDDYSQRYVVLVFLSRLFTKRAIRQLYLSQIVIRSCNVDVAGADNMEVANSLYVFDIRKQKNLMTHQPFDINLKYSLDFFRNKFLRNYLTFTLNVLANTFPSEVKPLRF